MNRPQEGIGRNISTQSQHSTDIQRVAFIGNSPPRRCGIATFTSDLQQAVAASRPDIETSIVAMTDHGQRYDYPPSVCFSVNDQLIDDYVRAADLLNAGHYDVACLQHEFGIFGGEAGRHILTLLTRLQMPIVTTLHTVLSQPSAAQRDVLQRIVALSSRVIVMAEKGRELLRSVYGVPDARIAVIAHGIPDFAFVEPDAAKARLGYSGQSVILTFGLLNPNKGIEVMIDAMPAILKQRPDAVYVVLGATHPNLVREKGEQYRDSLIARAAALGIADHVVFLNQFVDLPTLLGFISACDVYVTPYLNVAQMTSGTLAYSFGLGKAVVSTPYWHAEELLAEGRGILVPFADAGTTGREIAALLTDDERRLAIRRRAYDYSRTTTWARTAEAYDSVFIQALREQRFAVAAARMPGHGGRGVQIEYGQPLPRAAPTRLPPPALPPVRVDHLVAMCDDTGLFQHAVHSVPDRAHGYCVDDNARALLVACALCGPGETRLPEALTGRFASFIQHAWNPDTGRFRNFLSFDRQWLEDSGSEDSHARTLWALGECARSDSTASRRRWAVALFMAALPAAEHFRSPRAWAFSLLGLAAFCEAMPPERRASADGMPERLQQQFAGQLMNALAVTGSPQWPWFEASLAYDNARLPQALIVTGLALQTQACVQAGLQSLRWLAALEATPGGLFRPVGTDSFGLERVTPEPFDQQPLEATATIAACLAAAQADPRGDWRSHANRAFAWFVGSNDLSVPLVDRETGSCRDGLHPGRANENRGGKSVVSYLLALTDMRRLSRAATRPPLAAFHPAIVRDRGERSIHLSGERFVTSHVPEPPGASPAARPGPRPGAPVQASHRTERPQAD